MEARERSLGELISDLVSKASILIQEELALARSEMSTKVSTVSRSAGMLAGGAASIVGLHALMPWWTAALLVGLILLAGGYLLIQTGIQTIKRENLAPRRTIGSLRRGYRETTGPVSGSAFSRQR